MKKHIVALACTISTVSNAHDLHLRGSSTNLPEFFPTSMNKDDVELYLSHHKKKEEEISSIFEVNKNDWLSQCAGTFMEYHNRDYSAILRSNFYIIDEPSGLCADHLTCAFDKCMADTDSLLCLNQTDLSSAEYDDVASTCNLPTSWLPGSIMFPKNAADVISAIKYAKKHNLQISIKSTGHSYFAANTKAGSLMLNMRDYAKYASGNDKVIECGTDSSDELGDACTLATARKKDAYIRVGGGQTWSEVHNAVNASNAVGNLSKSYGIAGGSSGSVGAAGGWLSGGGLSIGYEREQGLGVDQVLEFEVALPSGHHVRVFPTEWDDDNNDYITPQTTKVTALCNSNVVANEDDWDWQPCTDLDVSPEDLWMALRGGGGGTYGITLSVKYQLFEQNPFQVYFLGLGWLSHNAAFDDKEKKVYETIMMKFKADKTGALWEEARRTFTLFVVDFLFAPEKIGMSKETSLSCGSPDTNFQLDRITQPLFCWGNESAFSEISSAWNRTINGSELAKQDPELADLLSSKHIVFNNYITSFGDGPFTSWGEFSIYSHKSMFGKSYDDIFPANAIPDYPLPDYTPGQVPKTYCSINLPLALLESDDEVERELLFKVLDTVGGQHTTGGNMARLGDGMDSVSPSERRSGQSSVGIQGAIDKYGDSILNDYLAAVYKYSDDVTGFPGFAEYNHFCSEASTVSKTNWTESCDPKDEECFSVQELVWGEDLYAKLQDIKAAVDPDNLLDCYQCVKPRNK